MKMAILISAIVLCFPCLLRAVEAVAIDAVDLEGRSNFRVVTAGATWFYDRAGGGFSRIVDRDGRDWIAFARTPTGGPAAAAGPYRGMPNALLGRDNPDAGAGHPGKDKCTSTLAGPDLIRTVSKSGAWAWTWRFTATQAIFTMEKADAEHGWCFQYEGPINGRYAPREQYWGTDLGGPRAETPSNNAKEQLTGKWRWAYLGDREAPRVLVVARTAGDSTGDSFAYMGNTAAGPEAPDGMAILAFGRGSRPTLKGAGMEFRVGFIEEPVTDPEAHARVSAKIETMLAP